MDKRTEYVERLSAQIVAWDVHIDEFKDKAVSATSEEKAEYSKAIAALQLKRDEVAAKLQGISSSGESEWEEVKTGTENVWGEVKTILSDTITNIK